MSFFGVGLVDGRIEYFRFFFFSIDLIWGMVVVFGRSMLVGCINVC